MNATEVFEKLSASTWGRLRDAEAYGISQGEETLTDINLLDIVKLKSPQVRVVKTPKNKEKDKGTDWEWWFGNNNIGWLRYAVQAKKIDYKTQNYKVLNHKVDGKPQIDILETYSRVNMAIPLYCFYNYVEEDVSEYWKCNLPFDNHQLGCTITPLKNVRECINMHGKRNFKSLHRYPTTRPWRCLLYCPLIKNLYLSDRKSIDYFGFENVNLYRSLPSELINDDKGYKTQFFSSSFYNPDIRNYPRRILIVEMPE
jgi:hypothetical protein